MDHMRESVGPIIDAIHSVFPERVRMATKELSEISLDLIEAKFLGSQCRSPLMNRLWREVFPQIAKILASAPRQVVGSLCNGLLFMEAAGNSKATRWLEHLLQCHGKVQSLEELLAVGRIAAWVSGLPQYRLSALKEASKISATILSRLLDLGDLSEEMTRAAICELEKNPWYRIGDASSDSSSTIQLMKCGAFLGFGGPFLKPPVVHLINRQFVVFSGNESWHLNADRFGWSLVKTDLSLPTRKSARTNPIVREKGRLEWDGETFIDPNLVGPTSHAYDDRVLAVTTQTSFHVFLVINSKRNLHST